MVGIKTTGEQISILCHNGTIFDKPREKTGLAIKRHVGFRENPKQTSDLVDNRSWEQIVGGMYAKQYEYDSKPVAQQLMGAHKVSAFHPFIFQKSGKLTIIRNLAVRRHFVSYLVFISSIRVDPGPTNRSPENTYPRGKHVEIKVHRSSACVFDYTIYYIFIVSGSQKSDDLSPLKCLFTCKNRES